ncbi:type II secretion system secretin GspD [Spartinivicinus poritis]|uniref:Type II secretion system secretin GspD n=1 Tax=Spartinivicinus poritis TaxID=2994640 RepID=A0ABT5UBZ1_9GAMM|nr:type II secretion system secretin GspD [Spartinivicinus sp. A2-2]MDE1463847.1 type II secretion system secretin GspD [Spartinivicinus sp. A2-2]
MKRYIGSCAVWLLIVTAVPVGWSAQNQPSPSTEMKINMQDGDIRSFIQWIAERTGKNFVIDPRVKGRVSVISQEVLSPEEAYQVFLSVLQVHGFTALNTGQVTKIIPDATARHSGVPVMGNHKPEPNDEMVVQVIKPKNISAQKLVSTLRPLVPQTGHLVAHPDSNALIVSDRARNIDQLVKIVKEVDLAGGIDVEFIPLQHASAKDLVNVLKGLVPPIKSGTMLNRGISFVADERSNSILMAGDPVKRKVLANLVRRLDKSERSDGGAEVIYLHYQKAKDLAETLQKLAGNIQKGAKDAKIADREVAIEANEATNALVISGPPKIMKTIKETVRKLDIRRAQVLVEAVIVELTDKNVGEIGVQWGTSGGAINGDGLFAGTRHSTSETGLTPSFDGFPGGKDGAIGLGSGLTLGFYRNGSLRSLVRALASNDKANILSTPSLITLDNEEASIHVGKNIAVTTGEQTGSSSSSSTEPFKTFERRDVGLTLEVTPLVNRSDSVTLEVKQEISDLISDSDADKVSYSKREIKTHVLVDDNSTLVLGGLIKDKIGIGEDKVPFLGDLPVIGWLFRAEKEVKEKTNLMVFLKPTIIRNRQTAEKASNEKYYQMKLRQKEFRELLEKLDKKSNVPLLPDVS